MWLSLVKTRRSCSRQEEQPNQKAGAALLKEALELQFSDLGTVGKMVVDGRPDHLLGVSVRPLIQVDTQFDCGVRREFLRPAHDEFFRIVVEVFFNERRRVHRIEELVCVAQFQAYGVRVCPVLRGGVRERKTHTRFSAIKGSSVETRLANNEVGIGRKVHPKRLDLGKGWASVPTG